MRGRRVRSIAVIVPFVLAVACMHDYSKFDTEGAGKGGSSGEGGSPTGGGGTGATGGTVGGGGGGTTGGGGNLGGGGASGSGGATGGVSGAGGSVGGGGTGGIACDPGQKLCGTACVPNNDPATGCAAASCTACSVPNATAACAGSPPTCAVGTCSGNFVDCNGLAVDGCEVDPSQPNTLACGSCSNNCSKQGFSTGFVCVTGPVCGCSAPTQCKGSGSGSVSCNPNGHCVCGTTECVAGEACIKNGATQVCACNGSSPCVLGQTCCQNGGCKGLSSDPSNCGACGRICPTGTSCVGGVCQ